MPNIELDRMTASRANVERQVREDGPMTKPLGHRRWVIAEGYLPGWSHGPAPQMQSYETASILNV
jgi:hypothetical protein